ncbi:MAG: uroporphyrinogen-III synthase [Candidatus Hydrogenedentes bacterium]|jgi:uroporphyrinogen III methyltransferase/synthase|nr:uroporphyrinogen-III synthase [Candidatus Hydrogenedentota bacterium]
MTTSAPNTQPLAGKKIVVTRTRAQAGKLAEHLQAQGAQIIEFPTIEIRPPEEPLQLANLDGYDWVLFTSVNAVEYFAQGLEAIARSIREIEGASICAVGPATKKSIEALGLSVGLVPKKFRADSIAEAFQESGISANSLRGKKMLLPCGDLAGDSLPDALRSLGAEVAEPVVYRNVKPDISPADIRILIESHPDWVVFTSASTARNFSGILGRHNLAELGQDIRYASIGPMATEAARDAGIDVAVEATRHDVPGLVEAIVNCLGFQP